MVFWFFLFCLKIFEQMAAVRRLMNCKFNGIFGLMEVGIIYAVSPVSVKER